MEGTERSIWSDKQNKIISNTEGNHWSLSRHYGCHYLLQKKMKKLCEELSTLNSRTQCSCVRVLVELNK